MSADGMDIRGAVVPKSKRCTSRCPEAHWLSCEMARNHDGACVAAGYRWRRGRGHARPFMLRSFEQETGGHGLVFGVDRLPENERWCPAWPKTFDTWRGYRRWLMGAVTDPGITLTDKPCELCGDILRLGEKQQQTYGRDGWVNVARHDRCPSGRYLGPGLKVVDYSQAVPA